MSSHQTPTAEAITGLILCGGAGSRMGGADKGLLSFHGKALVDIALARLSPQVDAVIINANRNLREYSGRGVPVISDPEFGASEAGFQGPLAGMLAGLQAIQTPWMITVPCDCPLFPLDLVQQLRAARPFNESGSFIAQHPTFSLIHQSAAAHLEHFLQHGHRKLGDWLAAIGASPLQPADESQFRNLNTPQDLAG